MKKIILIACFFSIGLKGSLDKSSLHQPSLKMNPLKLRVAQSLKALKNDEEVCCEIFLGPDGKQKAFISLAGKKLPVVGDLKKDEQLIGEIFDALCIVVNAHGQRLNAHTQCLKNSPCFSSIYCPPYAFKVFCGERLPKEKLQPDFEDIIEACQLNKVLSFVGDNPNPEILFSSKRKELIELFSTVSSFKTRDQLALETQKTIEPFSAPSLFRPKR